MNTTLFPQTTKPLNIFEPRYLEMINFSMQTKTPIAVAFRENAEEIDVHHLLKNVRPIAGYGHPEIIDRRENGTLLIFLQGLGKVRLGKVKDQTNSFIVCESELITEVTLVMPENKPTLLKLQQVLNRWVHTHMSSVLERDVFIKSLKGPAEVVGAFSSYMVKDADLQQHVLEMDDINDKIETLYRIVESNEIIP